MKLFKKVFIFLVFASVFTFIPSSAGAVTPTPKPDPCQNPFSTYTEDEDHWTVNPALECINESIADVKITFHGLSPDQENYVICTGSQLCLTEEPIPEFILGTQDAKLLKGDGITNDAGEVSFTACGDGNSRIKIGAACEGNDDWFHGGNMYLFSVGVVTDERFVSSTFGFFYVARYFPDLTINPSEGLTTETKAISVSLSGTTRPGGEKRNNYQISLRGAEGKSETKCTNQGGTIVFSGPFGVGKQAITIKEQVNESKSVTSLDFSSSKCEGGFPYYTVVCEVLNPRMGTGSCTKPSESKDPKAEEYKAMMEELNALQKIGVLTKQPCGEGKFSELEVPGKCKTIKTALGTIKVDSPQGFIETVFKFVLMVASFGGVIIIIYAGYVFMTSRGDKEKIAGARETLTAAIVGLLFIVLSIVILEIIGVEILAIPGFDF